MTARNDIIFIDATRLVGRLMTGRTMTGIDRVCIAYIERYADQAHAAIFHKHYDMFCSRRTSKIVFDHILAGKKLSLAKLTLLASRDNMTLSRPSPRGAVVMNVSHSGVDTDKYMKALKKYDLKPVFMVHDLIPIIFPEYAVPGESERHRLRIGNMLQSASAIVTNSKATLDDLAGFAANNNLPMPLARSAPLGTTDLPETAGSAPLDTPYFVLLGTIEPRKNHLMILHVWRELARKMGDATPKLVIIGHRGWECENIVDMLERCEILQDHIIELSDCPDETMSVYLANARALLFPSFAEGFGLPLCEALAMGVPVLAADLPVFHEFAGDIPDYLDPLDAVKWAAAVQEYARNDAPGSIAQKERMTRFTPPTWNTHFEVVDDILESLEEKHG